MGRFDILPEPNPEWLTKPWYLNMVRGIATSAFLIVAVGIAILAYLAGYEITMAEYIFELFHPNHIIGGYFVIFMSSMTCCGLFVVYLRLVYMPVYKSDFKGSMVILSMICLNFMVLCGLAAEFVTGFPTDVELIIRDGIVNYNDGNDGTSTGIDIMQQELHCCGINDYGDWKHNKMYECARRESPLACGIPWSCCIKRKEKVGETIDMFCGYGSNITNPNAPEIFEEDIMYMDGCQSKVLEGIYNSEKNFLFFSMILLMAQGLCLLVEIIAIYYLKKARVDPESQQSVHAGNQQSVRERDQQYVDIESSVPVRDQQFESRNVSRPTPSAPIDINAPFRRQLGIGLSCSEMRGPGFRQSLSSGFNINEYRFVPCPNGRSGSIGHKRPATPVPYHSNRILHSVIDSGHDTDSSGSECDPHPTPVFGSDSDLRLNSPSGSDSNLRPNSPSGSDSNRPANSPSGSASYDLSDPNYPGVFFIDPDSLPSSDYFTPSDFGPSSNLVTVSGASNGSGSNLVVPSGSSNGYRSDFVTASENSDGSGSNLATTSGPNNGSGSNLDTATSPRNGSILIQSTDPGPGPSSLGDPAKTNTDSRGDRGPKSHDEPGPSSPSDSGHSCGIILNESDMGPYSKFAVKRAVYFEEDEDDTYEMIEFNPDPKPKE